MKKDLRSRYRGALVGLAVGDAMGATLEFTPRDRVTPISDMVGGGIYRLPPGAWTDDTSMALCLAESLVERGGFDPMDQLQRYVRWYREGYNSSTGRCLDIGNTTSKALEHFEWTGEIWADPEGAGNGALMRLAPVVLFFAKNPEQAIRFAGESALTTHGHPLARDACRFFSGLLLSALQGLPKCVLLSPRFWPFREVFEKEPLEDDIQRMAEGEYCVKPARDIRSTGYVVHTLEAALWAFCRTDTFEEGLLQAIHLGEDADTVGAVYGQLAGAYYGYEAIPSRWREKLIMEDKIRDMADRLFEAAWG